MAGTGTLLKALLKQRHLQEHRAFCREYDRVAASIDRDLIGGYPSKATFYRWLSGDVLKLPHPSACRILEAMFPGRSVAAMFEPWDSNELPMATGTVSLENASQSNESLAGVTAIYASRTEFSSNLPATKLFDEARRVDAVGLSLNILCQGYPDVKLHRLLRRAEMRFLFLDPDGRAIRDRNNEEGHEEGHLSALTRSNISFIQRLRLQLEGEAASRVEVKVYDETVRFNLMFIDEELGVMQTYLPGLRGLASPTFVMSRRSGGATGLYEVYADLFEQIWQGGRTL